MSTIRTNTLLAADGSTTTEPSIPALDQRMAKAWVNFNGTGTVAINGAYNVSSITDNGVGDYTVNFATTMFNANYAAACSCIGSSSTSESLGGPTTSKIDVHLKDNGTNAFIDNSAGLQIFSN